MTETAQGPVLAAVLPAPDGYEGVRVTLASVHAQSARDRIEMVLVVPDAAEFDRAAAEFPGFAAVRVVPVGPIDALGPARAAGARAASAPYVVFLEDHAWPAPGWADALIRAFEGGPWSAVAPVIGNANPRSATSWANLFAAYGRWVAPGRSGERDHLPGHNCAYRRDVLLAEGRALDERLGSEWTFHAHLRAHGHRLYLTADARTDHQNISHLGSAILLRYHGGRQNAADRSQAWSRARRTLLALAWPLIPAKRLSEVVSHVRASGTPTRRLARMAPVLAALLLAGGIGEAMGYALGAGASRERKARLEHDRLRHLNRADRAGAPRPPEPVQAAP